MENKKQRMERERRHFRKHFKKAKAILTKKKRKYLLDSEEPSLKEIKSATKYVNILQANLDKDIEDIRKTLFINDDDDE